VLPVATRVYLESLGCKLNQCERDSLAGQFAAAGFDIVADAQRADVCVLNSCAVTAPAVRKSRRRVRALRRINPGARLVMTGCYAGLVEAGCDRPDALPSSARGGDRSELPDLVVPNARKEALVSIVQESLGDDLWLLPSRMRGPKAVAASGALSLVHPRTRPLVKVQDGCDNACSYCIVHRLRGKQRSWPRDEIVTLVLGLRDAGYHEVVLTGVHVGAYGRERGESLTVLIGELLAALGPSDRDSLRLRLSSIEPWDLTTEFLNLWDDPRLCRHLHLPLQSGCDATLARMNRRYTTAQYAGWVDQARAAIPGLAVTTDVIAGLPGETAQEHRASLSFCERMHFARTHVFTYSARPGTPAAEMDNQVPSSDRHSRATEHREVGRRSAFAYRRRFLGHTLPVLLEWRRARDGRWVGWTDNYLRVYVQSSRGLGNTLCQVCLCELEDRGVRGELAERDSVENCRARGADS
jgi:threonylcarbamoyladenosine tRNA methylthiotransferase MtaB